MESSQALSAEAKPYIPLPPPFVVPPPPMAPCFFTQTAPCPYQAPPPRAEFLGGFSGCWGTPLAPGGVGMQGAFPHPAWAPLVPPPHGAIPMPAGTLGVAVRAIPHGVLKHPSPGSVRTERAPVARPPPRLDVPPRLQRPARPGGTAASRAAKAAGAVTEEAGNEPSPRSVLSTTSPPEPVTPTTSLPPATAALVNGAELSAASPPAGPQKRRCPQGRRRAQQPPGGEVRRCRIAPRLLFDPSSERTSLMIRDIPNDFTRRRLMSIIDEHCFIENQEIPAGGVKSEYDFLYVPMDFRTLANKGYAFVNMTSPEAAHRLWEHLHGHRWEVRRCGKTCAVDYAATQGLDKLVNRFSGSSFDCGTEEFLPARFEPPRDGTRPAVGVLHVLGCLRRRS